MNVLPLSWRAVALSLLVVAPTLVQAGFFSNNTAQAQFLPADEAFVLDAIALDAHTVEVRWTIAPGYYLYRHRLSLDSPQAQNIHWQAPAGQAYEDEHFGEVQIFHDILEIPVKIDSAQRQIELNIGWQGCAEAGLCYPPKKRQITLNLDPS